VPIDLWYPAALWEDSTLSDDDQTAGPLHSAQSATGLDRPFHFIIVLWGERFRNYFLDYCLASLLAPGNIPALSASQPNKFIIATRPDDWAAIKAAPIFRLMERYITAVFLEIPPCPPGRSGCEHMGVGHKLALEIAYREKAYAAVLTPDCMLSDGTIARLQVHARAGIKLVLVPALRFSEDAFLGHLAEMGAIPPDRPGERAAPLAITGQQMAFAAVNGLHLETLSYEWNAPYFVPIAPAAWWRVPGEDGIVLHSLSWAFLLLDYEAVTRHDTSTLDDWTLDGDYLYKNFGRTDQIHVVQDSDEMFLASWGPESEIPFYPFLIFKIPIIGKRLKAGQFRHSFYNPIFDPLKRDIFYKVVRWHGRPVNHNWDKVENSSSLALSRTLKRQKSVEWMIVAALLGMVFVVGDCWRNRRIIARRLFQILTGHPGARARVMWRVRILKHYVLGNPLRAPPPEPPIH
jgi:hypothetical protein